MLHLRTVRIKDISLTPTVHRPDHGNLARPESGYSAKVRAETSRESSQEGLPLVSDTSKLRDWLSLHGHLPPQAVPPVGEQVLVALLPLVPEGGFLPNDMDIDHLSDGLRIRQHRRLGTREEQNERTVVQDTALSWEDVERLTAALLVKLADRQRKGGA